MFVRLFFGRNINCFKLYVSNVSRRNLSNALSARENNTGYKYLLFLDFEATCDVNRKIDQEIIEFPCVKVNLSNFAEEGRFHEYVRPLFSPVLTKFCIELTGILQEVVDEAKTFPEVLYLFEEWREQEGLTGENSLYVTSGDWDLGVMIPRQCVKYQLEIPSHMKQWVDIKKLFGNHRKFYNSFYYVMQHYGLEFEGRAHSGIADALNLSRAAKKMVEEGIEFEPTSKLVNFKVESIKKPVAGVQISPKMFRKQIEEQPENSSVKVDET